MSIRYLTFYRALTWLRLHWNCIYVYGTENNHTLFSFFVRFFSLPICSALATNDLTRKCCSHGKLKHNSLVLFDFIRFPFSEIKIDFLFLSSQTIFIILIFFQFSTISASNSFQFDEAIFERENLFETGTKKLSWNENFERYRKLDFNRKNTWNLKPLFVFHSNKAWRPDFGLQNEFFMSNKWQIFTFASNIFNIIINTLTDIGVAEKKTALIQSGGTGNRDYIINIHLLFFR